jgi:hypothetical protein
VKTAFPANPGGTMATNPKMWPKSIHFLSGNEVAAHPETSHSLKASEIAATLPTPPSQSAANHSSRRVSGLALGPQSINDSRFRA